MNSSLYQLWLSRLVQFFREPSAVFWTFGFPIILTLALGIAFRNRPPESAKVVVEDSPQAEAVRATFAAANDIEATVQAPDAARTALRVGRADLLVRPGTPITYEFDATRPESRLARLMADRALQHAAGRADALAVADRLVTEPGSRYVDFLVPGLIGVDVMSSGMWGVAYVIVEDRQKKLLKRLIATPMKRGEFLMSFVLMRVTFLFLEVPVLLAFARLVFDVPMRGSVAVLAALCLAGALAFTGLGMLLAARARNTQTVNGLINLVQMPMFLMSGVFFSAARFPAVMQPLVKALPLTALNDSLREVMNEGASFAAVLPRLLYLVAMAAVCFGLALKTFRWT